MPWYAPIARAVPALAVAVWITLSADHSPTLGLLTLGVFALAAGLIVGVTGMALRGIPRGITVVQGALTLVTGVIALAFQHGGLPFFLFLLTVFAAVTGFLELYLGLRSRGRDRYSRDWVFAGALTALLALVVLIVPPDFNQPLGGLEQIPGELTASVIVVGLFGAYLALLGVYLAIAGFSLRTAPAAESAVTPEKAPVEGAA